MASTFEISYYSGGPLDSSCAALELQRGEVVLKHRDLFHQTVADVKAELENTRLKFGDPVQCEKLRVLEKAEELIGKERWSSLYEEWVPWERDQVYKLSAQRVLTGDF